MYSLPLVSVQQVSDPDLLVAGISGADLEPCQLSRRPLPSKLARVAWPGLCLDMANLGPAMLFTGGLPKESFTFIFVRSCPQPGRSFNFAVEHTDGYMGFFPPGSSLDATTPEGYTNATLTISARDLYARIARYLPELPDKILETGAGMRVGSGEQASMRALLALVEESMSSDSSALHVAQLHQGIHESLLSAFLSALRSGLEDLVPPCAARTGGRLRRLRQARDFVAAHLQQPLYLNDVCGALNLTPRAVENLFRDLLGVNPITYLRHKRLHGVRRALKAAEPAPGIVKRIALDWGFWHLGRFASEYRHLFGEHPKETLQRQGG